MKGLQDLWSVNAEIGSRLSLIRTWVNWSIFFSGLRYEQRTKSREILWLLLRETLSGSLFLLFFSNCEKGEKIGMSLWTPKQQKVDFQTSELLRFFCFYQTRYVYSHITHASVGIKVGQKWMPAKIKPWLFRPSDIETSNESFPPFFLIRIWLEMIGRASINGILGK